MVLHGIFRFADSPKHWRGYARNRPGLAGHFISTYLRIGDPSFRPLIRMYRWKTAGMEALSRCQSISRTRATCRSRGNCDTANGGQLTYIGSSSADIDAGESQCHAIDNRLSYRCCGAEVWTQMVRLRKFGTRSFVESFAWVSLTEYWVRNN